MCVGDTRDFPYQSEQSCCQELSQEGLPEEWLLKKKEVTSVRKWGSGKLCVLAFRCANLVRIFTLLYSLDFTHLWLTYDESHKTCLFSVSGLYTCTIKWKHEENIKQGYKNNVRKSSNLWQMKFIKLLEKNRGFFFLFVWNYKNKEGIGLWEIWCNVGQRQNCAISIGFSALNSENDHKL